MRSRARLLIALLVALLTATGCGSSSSPSGSRAAAARVVRPATLMLDFTPNAVHAGIYAALARGYDRTAGVSIKVRVPGATTDSIKLLETGRVKFAILDIHDLAIARERGANIVGVMAVVQRPLAAVVAAPSVRTPLDLEGKLVGITGVPSDTAVLDSIVAGAGGDPRHVRTITIGFDAVPDLLAGRVAAATAFWSDEGITLARARPGFHSFRVDDYGAPSYPELVLCATRATVRSDPGLVRGVVGALVRGYRFAVADPGGAAADLERAVTGLDPRLVAAQLRALVPSFRAADGRVGELDVAALGRWAAWEARFRIVSRPPDVAAMFAPAATSG